MDSQEQPASTEAKNDEKTHQLSSPSSTDNVETAEPQQRGTEVVYPKRPTQILILTSLCLSVCKSLHELITTLS